MNMNGRDTGTATADPETDQFQILSHDELMDADIAQPNELVEGLIDEATGNTLAGPPGVGKTWTELDLLRSIAAGVDWLGKFPTAQGTALIFDEESHLPGVQSRVKMLERGNPLGKGLPLYFAVGHGLRLDTQIGASHLEAQIRRYRPAIVALDSFTRIHGVDENNAGDLASVHAVMKALMRTYGTAFLSTDHVRKKSLLNDPEEMLRGSTEKRAWPDCILFAAPGENGTIQMSHVKARWHDKIPDFSLSIDVDKEAGTATVSYVGLAANNTVTKANEIISAIHDLKRQLGEDGADAVRVAAWLECHPDTVRRHATKLIAAGILATRKVAPSEKGGKPKDVYDVIGGRD
ncbi:MAG: hypothetical protein QOJ59_571 [Thermomicrobiales bacterium]|jgi:hypothetical protein|nr:hypothetical protein [Thermomicrobiales bacterium]